MDFDFTQDQEQLRDAVRKYVNKAYTFERRRSIVAAGGFDRSAYTELAELGLTGLCIGNAYDGLDMGPVECTVVQEELGRGLVLEPLMQTYMCSPVIENFAAQAFKKQCLPKIAAGELIVVLAHQERIARYRLEVCEAQAVKVSDSYAVSGTKNLVPAGDQADAYLVPAIFNGQMALFWIERTSAGVTTRAHGCQDGSRAADVMLHNAPAQLVTANGLAALELAIDIGISCTCATAVGVMDQTLDVTVNYMNTRKQFGSSLASFQVLRHRVADMKMQLELGRSMAYFAALKLGPPAPERRRAMAQAKYQLGQSMRYVGQQAVQLHGGIGVTDEYIVSHYFKRLTQLEVMFGDSLHQLGEVSARMQGTAGVLGF
jgi:alkylation response protein AidB-like acyl-CoA dehydrogenase